MVVPSIEVGRVCVKLNGREAGRKCVIVDVIDKNFVLVTGPKKITGVKRRRTNVKHLEPTTESIDIKKGGSDDEVVKVIEKAKKTAFLKEIVAPQQIAIPAA
jgi:large subunit ribosomal protein L14e